MNEKAEKDVLPKDESQGLETFDRRAFLDRFGKIAGLSLATTILLTSQPKAANGGS